MKFAQELDQEAVAEWKPKYLNYRLAKKKLKAVSHAIRDFNRTPNSTVYRTPVYNPIIEEPTVVDDWRRQIDEENESDEDEDIAPETPRINHGKTRKPTTPRHSARRAAAGAQLETQPLVGPKSIGRAPLMRYGSIIGSPPRESVYINAERPPSLRLPEPAINSASGKIKKSVKIKDGIGKVDRSSTLGAGSGRLSSPAEQMRRRSTWQTVSPFRRIMSIGGRNQSPATDPEFQMDVYRGLENAQNDFFKFLDQELDKIETFYKEKEEEATDRLNVLRDQLHILRDRRLEDLIKTRQYGSKASRDSALYHDDGDSDEGKPDNKNSWFSWPSPIDRAWTSVTQGKVGRKSVAMGQEGTPEALRPADHDRDYVRRRKEGDISYRTAKRKLKLAMQEYYRALELLKSYAILNRTAFRKITKKYDKAAHSRPTGRYMSEKVNKSWFVKSDVLDGHIQAVEDLYSRYFEAGNHKIAANKLRKATKIRDYHGGAMFRNGIFLGVGSIFGALGVEGAYNLLQSSDRVLATHTGYLLQIYGGYFLILLLALFFCMATQFWTRSKVNYVFIFEFDSREYLDWRQLLELPSLFALFLGFFMWLNFTRSEDPSIFTYFPVMLITLSAIVLFCPLPILYWKARVWFLDACWRLLWSGLFPVEFRDFFLGDLFCSLSYSMGNIELFFCLYAHDFDNPAQCNSSNSRLLGFFAALPGVWRALQCLRRYHDTRNVFPHLVNCGKYTCTILFYVTLSLYRINKTHQLMALFIAFGAINSTYCSIWDLVMDWSLLDPTARKPFLRSFLAYKQTWLYYLAIVVDPILRFNWIFYAIFADDLQHSAFLSFAIALSEVFRRGLWTILRVENEHCTNVGRFRASRDVPLPFQAIQFSEPAALESGVIQSQVLPHNSPTQTIGGQSPGQPTLAQIATGSDQSRPSPSLRLRKTADSPLARAFSMVGAALHGAHAQDFERRKKDDLITAEDPDSSDDDGLDHIKDDHIAEADESAEADLRKDQVTRDGEGSSREMFEGGS